MFCCTQTSSPLKEILNFFTTDPAILLEREKVTKLNDQLSERSEELRNKDISRHLPYKI